MNPRLPLFSLLSQCLVAFIIEFDNEFEVRVPHRTTNFGGTRGAPFLVSMAMWTRFMRFVPEDGITIGELQKRLRHKKADTFDTLKRMSRWWRYVVVAGDTVRPTPGGKRAIEVWSGLTEEIEQRWRSRYDLDQLKRELEKYADPKLPDYLPILGFGLWSRSESVVAPAETLPGLLSNVLLTFVVEYERQSEVSLAIGANVLRLISEERVRVRDLPGLACVSKESIAMAVNFLSKQGYAELGAQRTMRLTAKGRSARDQYFRLVGEMEKTWNAKELRAVMEPMSVEWPEAPPGTWRAQSPRGSDRFRSGLPHFPMILHRGGFPDGS